ncbi:DUF724 domain-containing protein [Clostridium sp. VAP52]|uniref:DUF724 domain-containing protein n=1 Tax=Clostridium sp. VAP52 TaxID=2949977 RepID=UPI0020796BC3|nr:DUF724 domain-containing protein [Clostridium sp. VAP52]
MKTELERISKVLNIRGSENLCLKIQDYIKNKDKELKKLKFMNCYYREKFKIMESRNNNVIKSDNTYRNDKEIIKLKKLNAELNQCINGLKHELSQYHKERVYKIINSCSVEKEYLK